MTRVLLIEGGGQVMVYLRDRVFCDGRAWRLCSAEEAVEMRREIQDGTVPTDPRTF